MSIQNSLQKRLIPLVEKKYNSGKRKTWRNKDFENLSFEIHRDTKVLISVATLKRFFGKVKTSTDYTPQDNTFEALSLYVDYDASKDKRPLIKYGIISAFVLIILGASGYVLLTNSPSETEIGSYIDLGSITLTKLEGKCPATASFDYTLPKTKEAVFLDFGDHTLRLALKQDGSNAHFYAYPGYFNAVLRSKKQILSDTAKVFVSTDGWQALAHYFNTEDRERYYPIPLNENIKDGAFYASKKNIKALGIDTKEIVVVRLDNFKKTHTNGDNFICTSRFKNASFWPAVRCYATTISIIGESGKVQLKFVAEGCSRFCATILSEKTIDSLSNDLNGFIVNHNKYIELMVINKNKAVDIFVNQELVFSDVYTKSIGDIIGATIMFNGSGSVRHFDLNTLDNQSIISTNF